MLSAILRRLPSMAPRPYLRRSHQIGPGQRTIFTLHRRLGRYTADVAPRKSFPSVDSRQQRRWRERVARKKAA